MAAAPLPHPTFDTGDAPVPSFEGVAVPIVGENVTLRPVTSADYGFCMDLELTGANAVAYRHRGTSVAPDQFAAMLWQGVLTQFLIIANDTGARIGIVVAYAADLRNGHAHLAVVVRDDHQRSAWPLEAVEMFLRYLFKVFPLRKLYCEASGLTAHHFDSGFDGLVHLEGCFRAHDFYDGAWWDKRIYAIYRDEWLDRTSRRREGGLAAALRAAAAGDEG